ncbi:MAG: hypothetical protein K9H26_06515 [Prolixibacteraceae bacterium]|nr:hypothetical protein [Prolixibacteraceae bacterium]
MKSKFFLIISFILLQFFSISYAQKDILLVDDNIEGFKLIREMKSFWQISADSLTDNVLEQKWSLYENDEYYISYCEFDNEEDAIKGVAYNANSSAMPFIFGSPTGEIVGNVSWRSLDGSAICFQKNNIGIKIFKPLNVKEKDKKVILSISNNILEKINANISSNIRLENDKLLNYLSHEQLQKITENYNNLLTQDGYSEFKVEKSKWVIAEDSLLMGYRKEWSKKQSIFYIDIALLSNSNDALEASEFRSKITSSPLCILGNDESISVAINDWINEWNELDKLSLISIIGIKGNLSLHFYYYNNAELDFILLNEILKSIN